MGRLLFNDISIGAFLDDRHRKLAAAIAELPIDVLLERGVDELAVEYLELYRLEPLVLHWDAATAEAKPVEVEVVNAMPKMSRRREPTEALGLEVTQFIPFSGTPGLFDARPSTHTETSPEGFVRNGQLTISYSRTVADVDTLKAELDRSRSDVDSWVARLKTDVDAFNAELPGDVRGQLQARVDKALAADKLLSALGVPQRRRLASPRVGESADPHRPFVATRHDPVPAQWRAPGRPGWTSDEFEEHWRQAKAATPQPQTFKALAEHFRASDGVMGGVSGDHLRRLRTKRFPVKRP